MLRKNFMIFAVFLSISNLVFAVDAQTAINLQLPTWAPLLGVALGVGFGLAAISYILSSIFRLPELNVWAKTEVAELTQSALIAVIVLIAAGFGDSIFAAATGYTPMQLSTQFVDGLMTKSLSLFSKTVLTNWLVGVLSGIPPQYVVPAGASSKENPKTAGEKYAQALGKMKSAMKGSGLQIPILFIGLNMISVQFYDYAGTNTFLGHFGLLQSVVLGATGLAIGIKVALNFIEAIALPVLVPLGVFLGIFAITRKMGRTLIAIGICLYFFLPASVLISKLMYEGAYHPGTDIPEIASPESLSKFQSFALNQLIAQVSMMAAAPFVLSPLVGGAWLYQIFCVLEAAIIAIPCLIAYPACYAAYFFPCFTFIKPFIIWPNFTFLNYILYTGATIMTKFLPVASQVSPGAVSLITGTAFVPGISGIGSFTASFYINKYVAELLTNVVLDYTPYVLQFAVPITLMPFIILIVLITAMRSISPAIGGEIQILGVSELI